MILAIQTSYKKTGFGQITAESIKKYKEEEKKLNTKIAKLVNQINEAKKKLGEPPLKGAFYLIQEIYNKTLQSLPPKETVSPEKYKKLYYETHLKNLQKQAVQQGGRRKRHTKTKRKRPMPELVHSMP